MPIYEMVCQEPTCKKTEEYLLSIRDPKPVKCEHCGKDSLVHKIGAPALEFKGSGYFVNDYGGKKQR